MIRLEQLARSRAFIVMLGVGIGLGARMARDRIDADRDETPSEVPAGQDPLPEAAEPASGPSQNDFVLRTVGRRDSTCGRAECYRDEEAHTVLVPGYRAWAL